LGRLLPRHLRRQSDPAGSRHTPQNIASRNLGDFNRGSHAGSIMRPRGNCMRKTLRIGTTMMIAFASVAVAQVKDYKPVTEEMLKNPSPEDWLMYSRTYDAQRFSPLKQIDKQNVGQLGLA